MYFFGQSQYAPTSAKTRFVNGIGLSTKDTASLSNAGDTLAMIVGKDSLVYFKYKGYWKPIAYNSSLNFYVKYSDTATMLSSYYNKTATNSLLSNKLNISDTASMLSGYKTYYPRNAISGGTGISYNPSTGVITNTSSGTVTSVATNNASGITGGTITTSGTIAADTSILATRLRVQKGIDSVSANVNLRVIYTDTSSMLSPYYRTATATSALALKLNISDTAAMLSPYARSAVGGYVPYTGATSNVNLGTKNIYANAIYTGFSAITASGTQVVLTVNSAPEILVSGSGGQTIKLPDATTLQNGTTYSFNNNQSSGAITINNNSNTLVVSIPSGGYAEVILLDNSIAAGSWDRHFQAPANVSWSTNTFDYPGSITSATWNGSTIAINRGGTGATTASAALTNLGGLSISDTATMLSPYIRTANYGLTKTGQGLGVDTALIATRLRVQKGIDSLASVVTGGYVPYTGATGAVNLGAYGLTSSDILVSKNQNAETKSTISNTTAGTGSGSKLRLISESTTAGEGSLAKFSGSYTPYKTIGAGDLVLYNTTAGNITILNDKINKNINFAAGGVSTAQATLFSTGNFAIGSTTDDGSNQLQVTGSSKFTGNVTTDGTFASNSATLLTNGTTGGVSITSTNNRVRINGGVDVSVTNLSAISGSLNIKNAPAGAVSSTGSLIDVLATINGGASAGIANVLNLSSPQSTQASGDMRIINISPTFTKDAGTGVSFRGIYYNPNISGLTSGFTHNAYENTSGNVLLGTTSGSTGIGATSTINASAILQVTSTTQGILPPRMTTTQRDAISSPATGLQVYNTTTNTNDFYNGTAWASGASGTYVTSVTGTSPIVSSGGTTPAISIPVATTSVSGYLSSTDWTTFNNKQAALTNPVTGTGTTNYLPKFTGASTIGNSAITDDGTTVTLNSRALSGTSASFSGGINFTGTLGSSSPLTIIQSSYAGGGNSATKIVVYNPFNGLDSRLGMSVMNTSGSFVELIRLDGSTSITNIYGALSGTSATFSSSVQSTNIGVGYAPQSNIGAFIYRNASDYALAVQQDGSGVPFQVTSGAVIRLYVANGGNVGINTTSPSYLLDVNGTGRFSGILTTSGGRVTIQGTNQNAVWFNQNGGGTSTGYLVGRSYSSDDANDFFIYNVATSTRNLAISSTGAATFSSSINNLGLNAAPTSTGTGVSYLQFRNTGNDFYIGNESSTAGGFFTGSSAYASVLYSSTAQEFIIGGVRRLQIATTGAATFSSSVTAGSITANGTGYSIFQGSAYLQTPASTGLSFGWNRSGGNGEATIVWGAAAAGYNFEIASVLSGTITPRLTILTTGAATFSSSVTATSFIKTSGTSAQILAADGSVITAGANITISGGTISSSGVSITLSAIGSTPNANAATLTGSALNLEPASASFGGVVTTGTQTFAGTKTFSSTTAQVVTIRGTSGGGTNNSQLRFYGSASAADLWAIGSEVATGTSGTAFDFYSIAGAANRLRIDGSGNVGIGTITIGSTLQVNGNAAIGYSASTAGPTNGLAVAGGVTIGTTTDAGYKLDVNGTGRFSGALSGTTATFSSSVNAAQLSLTGTLPSGNVAFYLSSTIGTPSPIGMYLAPNYTTAGTSTMTDFTIQASSDNGTRTTSIHNALVINDIVKGTGHTITDNYGLIINNIAAGTNNTALAVGMGLSQFLDKIELSSTLKLGAYSVSGLPTAGTAGRIAYVTDALAPTYNATVVGGGSVKTLVFDNGTNWTVH